MTKKLLEKDHKMDNIIIVGENCVGCRSCELACPNKCISMNPDHEGFLYPTVDTGNCISCGLCLKKCPVMNTQQGNSFSTEYYALKTKNKKDIFNSASGGAADTATKILLQKGGYVYGAAYDEDFRVKHIEVTNESGREKLQSSKYVQSDTGKCFLLARKRLNEGKYVLFTGTPCQIAGLNAFLGKSYDNLVTIDLICHGVPSPLLFKKYLNHKKRKMNGDIIYYNFRSKVKRGWGTQYLIKTKTKTKTKTLSLDKYGKHFLTGDCYRECCYQCKYANLSRNGDLTIGDFWGIEKCHPEFSSHLGVSLVLVNTSKGKQILDDMKDEVELLSCSSEEALVKQENLIHPTARPDERKCFYTGIQNDNFIDSLNVGLQLKERIKACLPAKLVKILKRYFV